MRIPVATLSRLFASCLLALVVHLVAHAQASPASGHSANCAPRHTPVSDAAIAKYRGDLKNATALNEATLAKDPQNAPARVLQIDLLMEERRYAEADKKLDDWTASDKSGTDVMLAASDVRLYRGEYRESYALALKALKVDPCFPDAYLNLATFEYSAGYRATAAKHVALAHQLDPDNDIVTLRWYGTLPGEDAIESRQQFLQSSKLLSDKERKQVAARFEKARVLRQSRCELASAKSTTNVTLPMVPMDQSFNPAFGLQMYFNGHPRLLQIDTGASGLTLSRSAAGTGLRAVSSIYIGGFGSEGASGAQIQVANTVMVGGLEFHNCQVGTLTNSGVLGGSHLDGSKIDNIDGLVGTDLFSRYLVTVDYIKHEIRLAPLPARAQPESPEKLDPLGGSNDPNRMLVDRVVPASLKGWTSIYRDGHMLIMPARIFTDEKQLPGQRLFILDTGADVSLVDATAAKEFTRNLETSDYIGGLSGAQKVFDTGKFTIDFADMRLPVHSMNSTDLSHMGYGITGFIGFPILKQLVMQINYRDNLMAFEAPSAQRH